MNESGKAAGKGDDGTMCASLVRDGDHDRYLCGLFVPDALRPRYFAALAFNLELARIREQVSEPMLGLIRLQWWREAIEALDGGRIRGHPVVEALAASGLHGTVGSAPLLAQIEARKRDLEPEPSADEGALVDYARATGGGLARMMLAAVEAADDGAAERAADAVGTAWALLGIARAAPFQGRHGLVLLPAPLLAQAGLDPHELHGGGGGDRLPAAIRPVAERARDLLAEARAVPGPLPSRAIPVLLPATLADLHLRDLKRSGYDPNAASQIRRGVGKPLRLAWYALARRY
ncbi:phytoene/squalene synthase family protein [Oceanibacterium hippocampi]|uniref:Squalene/phytoene synthase n=1 Tax=Oceanibacterium hippocampi TaxID=745714 RepID=A0A1Y5TAC7_9PROT|nr:squalene/phytoene synthase family protein [Oceanibacterium hippocampi]SLN55877.1 Squalene/phytoene synthase [Oceanibacterium hippocampi]